MKTELNKKNPFKSTYQYNLFRIYQSLKYDLKHYSKIYNEDILKKTIKELKLKLIKMGLKEEL